MTQIGMFNDNFNIYQKYSHKFYVQLFFFMFTVTNAPVLENTEIIIMKSTNEMQLYRLIYYS